LLLIVTVVELTRELGAQWGRLTDEQKQPFVRKAQEDKERYQREMAEYQPTEQETNSEKTDQKAPEDNVHDDVREYYSKVLTQTKDLKTSACTSASKPHPIIQEALKHVPAPIKEKFYGCGTPIPLGIDGLTVLDLGSGSGRDCYIAAKLVGEDGRVIGVDMTDEQLSVAKEHVDEYMKTLGREESNLEFRKGYIEDLEQTGIEPDSVDIVISNCVVNLSPKKDQVLRGVYRVLKEGGEFYFSDVYADRRIAKHVQEHKVLYGECISGASKIFRTKLTNSVC
jgi:SAM-dependent methyltransferase